MKNPPRQPPASAIDESFDDVVLPHLDAANRLARWLLRNEEDAEDVVQEASLRALRYFRTFTGGNGRAWFLTIVRNTCAGWYGPRFHASTDSFDEERHSSARPTSDPETLLLHTADVSVIERAMRALPHRSRELLVLRELEGLSYRELADALNIPMGTVMSGLSRARQALRSAVDSECSRFNSLERTRTPSSDALRLPEAQVHITVRARETASAGAGAGGHSVRHQEDS
jgi:RNA polymerase sigma-70 factor (ECF subfamily)